MKLLHWLGKAGKASMATLAGLGGVAAVAGVASWMYINDRPDDSNSFNLGGNQPSNIVYSSGGNADYNNYGGGEGESSVLLASSRNIKLIEQEGIRQAEQEQLAESERFTQQAFATSGSSGLVGNSGYQGNKIQGFEGLAGDGDDPMKSLSGLGDMMARAQAQAAAAGGAPAGGPAGAQGGAAGADGNPASLASQNRPDWSKSAALGGGRSGGGQGGSNQFVLQANGRGKAAGPAELPNMGDAVKDAQQQAARLTEGMRLGMAGKASFGNNQLGGDMDSHGGRSQERAKALDRIKFAQKRSADEAANKNRMAVTTAFLDGNRITGGITLDNSAAVSTGAGQSSRDFNSSFHSNLGNIDSTLEDLGNEELERDQDRADLKSKMWNAVTLVVSMMLLIVWAVRTAKALATNPYTAAAAVAFWIAAAAFTALGLYALGDLWVAANKFTHTWGETGLRNMCRIISGLGIIGLAGSWWLGAAASTAFSKGVMTMLSTLGAAGGLTGTIGLFKK